MEDINIKINEPSKEKDKEDRGTYFDDAIILCEYGKFHYYLFVAAIMGQIANVVVTADASFLLANAECDLKMTLEDKGILTAIPFAGMLASGLLTGFLSDAFGRKVFLVWGYLGLALCKLIQSTSQTFKALLIMKFLEGCVFTGPSTDVVTYMGELHDNRVRSKIIMFMFGFVGVCNVLLPLIGWGILPQQWNMDFLNGHYMFRSWHVFLMVNSVWPIITFIMFSLLPESPKFLLAHSRHDEALAILRKIYATNSGKSEDTYPVKKVYLNTSNKETRGFIKSLIVALYNIKPLFKRPHVMTLVHVCVMQFGIMLSLNTLQLWYPQLSTIFENYGNTRNESAGLCQMINEYLDEKALLGLNTTEITECLPVRSGSETFINSAILGLTSIIPYLAAGFLASMIGRRLLIFVSMGICGILASTIHLSFNSAMILSYFGILVTLTQISVGLMVTVTVDSFPTAFRALTVAALMLVGRGGSILGNIFFPYCLEIGCLMPFIMISIICFISAFLGLLIKN